MSSKDYYLENKEEIKRKAREYYHAHKDEQRARQQKRRADNPRITKNQNRKSRFGISLEEYESLHLQQGGVCGICKKPIPIGPQAHLDHCHQTKKIRGFLCVDCNLGLGRFKDNPMLLLSAARYIERHT